MAFEDKIVIYQTNKGKFYTEGQNHVIAAEKALHKEFDYYLTRVPEPYATHTRESLKTSDILLPGVEALLFGELREGAQATQPLDERVMITAIGTISKNDYKRKHPNIPVSDSQ